MALSRRDWNNVIIFAVLALMLLFFIVPQQLALLKQQQQPAEKVVAEGFSLMQLQFAETNIQQAGTFWHFQPQVASKNSAAEIASAWQQLQLQASVKPVALDTPPLKTMVLVLAGADSAQHWWLFLQQRQYYLQRQGQSTLYPINEVQYQQLFPQLPSDSF